MGVAALDHVLLLSDDIDSTRDFYCRAVGMSVGDRPPLPFPGYWLYAGGKPCLHIADRAVYEAHARSVGLDVAAQFRVGATAVRDAFRVEFLFHATLTKHVDLVLGALQLEDAGNVDGGAVGGAENFVL